MTQPPSYAEFDPMPMGANDGNDRSRPGRFDSLKGFLQDRGPFSGATNRSNYDEVHVVNPEPGAVIHIIDGGATSQTQSRLHERVMLVIRHESPVPMTSRAMTCVPLCSHAPDTLSRADRQHWNVKQELDPKSKVTRQYSDKYSGAGVSPDRQSLFVKLNRNLYLEEGITVNLAELWHVEYDHILIEKIGQASDESRGLAFNKVADLFLKSLDAHRHHRKPAEPKRRMVAAAGDPWNGRWEIHK